MKNLEKFNIKELNREEITLINGGEDGWYYLGRAAKHWYNFHSGLAKAGMAYVESL